MGDTDHKVHAQTRCDPQKAEVSMSWCKHGCKPETIRNGRITSVGCPHLAMITFPLSEDEQEGLKGADVAAQMMQLHEQEQKEKNNDQLEE